MNVFFVAGVPVEQGSKKAFVVGRRAVIVDNNKDRLKPWRAEVTRVARATWSYGRPIEGPVRVVASFVLPRPKSVRREYPSVRPDVDKLLRALFDGITDAEVVWRDDSQVVSVETSKVYGAEPGVHVEISSVGGMVLPAVEMAA